MKHVLAGVWDTGPGIPVAARRIIFEEFRRLDKDRHAPGLGLGLAIAERMARLLDHPLTLDSHEETRQFSRCQRPRAPNRSVSVRRNRLKKTGSAAGRVLIIDNDASMLNSLQTLFSGWGFTVHIATGAASAEAVWDQARPDLMILDYHLDQGHTGLEFD